MLSELYLQIKTHKHTQRAKPLNSPAKWNFTFKTMLFLLKMVFCFQMTHTNHQIKKDIYKNKWNTDVLYVKHWWMENTSTVSTYISALLLGNSCLLQVKLLRWRKWFSRPALTDNSSSLLSLVMAYICFTLIILWDTLSCRVHLLITHSHMFIWSSSLAFFLPPAGSLALLLSSSDRRWSSK